MKRNGDQGGAIRPCASGAKIQELRPPFHKPVQIRTRKPKKGWVVLVVPEVSKLESSVRWPLKILTQFDNFAHNVPKWVMENLVSAVQLCCLAMLHVDVR
jgi:hypothetical protein